MNFQFSRLFVLCTHIGLGELRLDLADGLKDDFRHKNISASSDAENNLYAFQSIPGHDPRRGAMKKLCRPGHGQTEPRGETVAVGGRGFLDQIR
ncbi:MAG TPA: hypothetical protein VEG60_21385 [Candidatus Binatia bacterium]|nr:hypothetical protein [Candidatus Binatia bacterium]